LITLDKGNASAAFNDKNPLHNRRHLKNKFNILSPYYFDKYREPITIIMMAIIIISRDMR